MKTYKMTYVGNEKIAGANFKKIQIYNMENYARKCSVTGEGMNEGWYAEGCGMYFANESDALQWCIDNEYKDLQEAYDDEAIYWTEFETEED